MFWWVMGGIFFMSGAIGGSILGSLYPSMLFLFGRVFQAIDCVRVMYALGAASWLVGVVIKVVKLYGDRPPVERPRPRDRVVTVLRVLACVIATSLVVGFAAVVGLLSVFVSSSSTFQVLSPSGPNGCHVIYEVSVDFRGRASGHFYAAPPASHLASRIDGGYLWLGYDDFSVGTKSDPINSGQWSLTWRGSQGTLLIQDADPINVDCSRS